MSGHISPTSDSMYWRGELLNRSRTHRLVVELQFQIRAQGSGSLICAEAQVRAVGRLVPLGNTTEADQKLIANLIEAVLRRSEHNLTEDDQIEEDEANLEFAALIGICVSAILISGWVFWATGKKR